MLLVQLGLLVLVLGAAYDMWTGREHWPFSPYPMYSRIEMDPTETRARLYGVPADDGADEFALLDDALLAPFDQARLHIGLRNLASAGESAALQAALRDVGQRYEERRHTGAHDGPELAALRLYELTWTVDLDDPAVQRPDRRELVAELEVGR